MGAWSQGVVVGGAWSQGEIVDLLTELMESFLELTDEDSSVCITG